MHFCRTTFQNFFNFHGEMRINVWKSQNKSYLANCTAICGYYLYLDNTDRIFMVAIFLIAYAYTNMKMYTRGTVIKVAWEAYKCILIAYNLIRAHLFAYV